MTGPQPPSLCPDDRINALLAALRSDEARGTADLGALLRDYPHDPRLHFMRGSLLASRQDYSGARAAMRTAVDLAPDYAIARFQLGFLLLTSGESHAAQEAWGPLHALPAGNALRVFARGLSHLIHDEFDDAIRLLEEGISLNQENAPLNRDMQMIIDEVRNRKTAQPSSPATSTVDFLLQQAALKATKH